MHLKQLELYGYKSFATRCQFEFSDGITAIVGPNGSGKSNIADAFRWVLGEQRNRRLRAKTVEDMIFAGSRRRARLGTAEVLITLDNASGWLPIEFTEVTIGRRAFRSGDSEYLLNGNRVRYRDILDLLGAAGLGASTHTVIGQGMVDAALALQPKARRTLFEEAAGIAPQLRKRDEALRRIAETERNLERVSDILNELRPRARTLRRQAERAEESLLLQQDLEELQRIWYGHRWQRSQAELVRGNQDVALCHAYLETLRDRTQALQETQKDLEAQTAEVQAALGTVHAGEGSLRLRLESLRRELAVMQERGRLLQGQRDSIGSEVDSLESRREILIEEIGRATAELDAHRLELCETKEHLETMRASMAQVDALRGTISREIEQVQASLSDLLATRSDAAARLEQVEARGAALTAERSEAASALSELQARQERLEELSRTSAESVDALVAAKGTTQRRLSALASELAAVRKGLERDEEARVALQVERDRLAARSELLTRLREELTGYFPGVREVLSRPGRAPGILGTVASLMTVPREYERAIEAALGSQLQNVVAERWQDAEKAIDHLKRTRTGWVTFLPLDTLRPNQPVRVRPDGDTIGVASELVQFEERLRPVYELLLGRVVVVHDLPAARQQLDRRTGASLFVTLDGEIVRPSGALSGGSRRRSRDLLSQEREWRELPGLLSALDVRLGTARQICADHREQADRLSNERESLERELSAIAVDMEQARAQADQNHQTSRKVERDCDWERRRIARAREQISDLALSRERLSARLAQTLESQETVTEHFAALRQTLADLGDERRRQAVARLETRYAVAERTVDSQRRLLQSHRKSLDELERQLVEKLGGGSALTQSLADLGVSSGEVEAEIVETEGAISGILERAAPILERIAHLERDRDDLGRQRTACLDQLREADVALNRASLARDRITDARASLVHDIEADLGPMDLPDTVSHQLRLSLGDEVIELPRVSTLPPGIGEEIRQLKARVRRLGNVNADAPHEYGQLLERETFLETQASDLRGAIATLLEVIEELERIIERDFSTTFHAVDASFGTYFQMLFNGGNARLVLTDPEDVSTTGVDIIAHPPGKRAQSLSLLSGGERALTAVALLFALLHASPVPFCFLDEVDAMLDEVNVGRFGDVLVEQSQATQFVVITHNRATIQVASRIYGISMSEQGVSQSISLSLDDVL